MEYKYIGLSLVIAVALYLAVMIKRYAENKERFYIAIYAFIGYIKNQIEYFCTPTYEFIEGYTDPFLEDCGFLRALEGNRWDRAVAECRYTDEQTKKLLLDFGTRLGRSHRDEQIANCEYTMDRVNEKLELCRNEKRGKYKAYSSLVIILGFMIVILLI